MYDGAGLMKESVSERGGLKQWAEMAREKSIPIIVTETLDGEQMGSLPEGTSLLARERVGSTVVAEDGQELTSVPFYLFNHPNPSSFCWSLRGLS